MRKKILIIGGVVLFIIAFAYLNKSNKVDWSPTFNEAETKPLDTKVFFEQLPFWFEGKKVKKIYTTFYEYDQVLQDASYDSLRNYINISKRYDIDETSFNSLLEYVEVGNEAFISASYFPRYVEDTLGFSLNYRPVELKEKTQTAELKYASDRLTLKSKLAFGTTYIKDTTLFKTLGTIKEDGEKLINFIGVPYGKGKFYVHTTPEVFTNYQMLEAKNTNYISTVISYLEPHSFIVDKAVKLNPETSQSPLRYIFSKPALKWSWLLLLLLIALFLLFNAKRRQRIIPYKDPLTNGTTEFVHTVSNLHYEAEDYNGVIKKNIVHFLEHVRSKYHLPTDKLNDDFVKRLALKAGKPLEEIEVLISLIIKMKSHNFSTKEPLKKLNVELQKFYKK